MSGAPRLVVIGVGLIGGSLARAARAADDGWLIHGSDPDAGVLERALADGVIDRVGLPGDPGPADMLVIAAPTLAAEAVLEDFLAGEGPPAGGAVITDTASVKGNLVRRWLERGRGHRFVPGHPIAGSERSGVTASRADLFRDHRVVLTPLADTDPEALARVTALWESAGARVDCMDVVEHDEVLALTSHLPHLLAFALVDTLGRQPQHEAIFGLAAGGFRDFTRIASSDPVMWSDVFTANRDAVLAGLDALRGDLDDLRALIESGDTVAMRALFARAKRLRDEHVVGAAAVGQGATDGPAEGEGEGEGDDG